MAYSFNSSIGLTAVLTSSNGMVSVSCLQFQFLNRTNRCSDKTICYILTKNGSGFNSSIGLTAVLTYYQEHREEIAKKVSIPQSD